MAARALHVGAVLATATPTRCSTHCSPVNIGNNHAAIAFMTSGMTHLSATTSIGAGNGTLQAVGRAGVNTPASCSTHVFIGPPDDLGARASAVDTDPPRSTSFPCFDGTNPCLWRAKCLQYFTRFNIHKCMWVVAATMHMEGKAKVWYESYKLRQVVGDWSEFMYDVEAHFGFGDLPPSTQILGVAPPNVAVRASGDISATPPTKGLTVNPRKVMDTATKPTKLAKVVSSEPPLMERDADQVLTHIGGMSLFLELSLESTDGVLADEQLADYLLTHIGDISLFFELGLEMPSGVQYDTDARQCLTLLLGSRHILFVDGTYDATPPKWPLQEHNKMWQWFGELPPWGRSGFSPGQDGIKSLYHVFRKWSPWIRSAFWPKRSAIQVSMMFCANVSSWQISGFSPGIKGLDGAFVLTICIAVVIVGFLAHIGAALGDNKEECSLYHGPHWQAAIVYLLGFWLLDFPNNTVQGPACALMVDLSACGEACANLKGAFLVLNCTSWKPELNEHKRVTIDLGTSAYAQLTEEATYLHSDAGTPLVFLSTCSCWHLESTSNENFDIVELLQVHTELYVACDFFSMIQLATKLQFKQWDPGVLGIFVAEVTNLRTAGTRVACGLSMRLFICSISGCHGEEEVLAQELHAWCPWSGYSWPVHTCSCRGILVVNAIAA